MASEFDIYAMRDRLSRALQARGLSKRGVSLRAKLGAGYLHAILEDGKEPTVSKLAQICEAAGLSMSYVLYGIEMSPETERLIRLIDANPTKRDGILALLSDK